MLKTKSPKVDTRCWINFQIQIIIMHITRRLAHKFIEILKEQSPILSRLWEQQVQLWEQAVT
jgi:hypothetical protein